MMDWTEEEQKYNEFWEQMDKNEGYLPIECPNCGRHRVEHWSCGKDICEKCHWCIQISGYFTNEYFDY